MYRDLWPDFARRRLAFSYCLNVDPRFFFLTPLFFFVFIIFFKVFQSVLPGRKPSLTVSRNRASDYFYPGSEYFILKTQFPCYRHFFLRSLSTLSRSSCVWLFLIPYYIIGNTSYFFFSLSPLFTFILFNCLDTSIRYISNVFCSSFIYLLLLVFFFYLGISFTILSGLYPV